MNDYLETDEIKKEPLAEDLDESIADKEKDIDDTDNATDNDTEDTSDDNESDDNEETQVSEKNENTESKVITQLRQKVRELQKMQKQSQTPAQDVKTEVLPKKPTLADDDIDYDEDKYNEKLENWLKLDLKLKQDEESRKLTEQSRLDSYKKLASVYPAEDFNDAESDVIAALSPLQQSALLEAATNPAAVVMKLAEMPDKLYEFQKMTSIVKFAANIGVLEKEMKTTTQRNKPQAEITIKGGAGSPATSNLKSLHEKAQATGNYTEYFAARDKEKAK